MRGVQPRWASDRLGRRRSHGEGLGGEHWSGGPEPSGSYRNNLARRLQSRWQSNRLGEPRWDHQDLGRNTLGRAGCGQQPDFAAERVALIPLVVNEDQVFLVWTMGRR